MRTVQVQATCGKMRMWEFGKLHERVHTMTEPVIDTIFEE